MDKRVLLLWAFLFVWTVATMAQDAPPGVVSAFKKGNSQELGGYLGDKVELILDNRSTNVDRRTAENQMATFFSANKVKSFTVNHQGNRGGSSFIIGTLATANGNFRLNCFFRKVENKNIIHQIRIDKTDE